MSTTRMHVTALALLAFGCGDSASDRSGSLTPENAAAGDDAGAGSGEGTIGAACTETGRSYPGLDEGTTLEGNRSEGRTGVERDRVKPFEALKMDLDRVLGVKVNISKGGFGEDEANPDAFENHYHDNMALNGNGEPKRTPTNVSTWSTEPKSGALEVYSIVEGVVAGCTAYAAKNAGMAQAGTAETASVQCAAMARAFWSRTPTPGEVEPCVKAATDGAAEETDPHRKWAWGCTTLITSANFLTY